MKKTYLFLYLWSSPCIAFLSWFISLTQIHAVNLTHAHAHALSSLHPSPWQSRPQTIPFGVSFFDAWRVNWLLLLYTVWLSATFWQKEATTNSGSDFGGGGGGIGSLIPGDPLRLIRWNVFSFVPSDGRGGWPGVRERAGSRSAGSRGRLVGKRFEFESPRLEHNDSKC